MSGFHHFQTNGVSDPVPEKHRIDETFQCFWHWPQCQDLHCNDFFYGYNLSRHLQEKHGIHGSDKDHVFCLWNSCYLELNKESLTRHVEEKHLKIVHPCGCGKEFSRRDTLNRHRREKQH
ncbi:hypothetical protein C8R48DRAFT_269827 [Suillus tomentosus]|nr:hypothetical protein C8R48DRAFT_269827 [Suillus tomentosus]